MTAKKSGTDRTANRKKKILALLLLVTLVLPLLPAAGISAHADSAGVRTVKVGYYLEPGMMDGNEGERKSGYAYEYIQKIASLAGWRYEYVYGSFEELYNKLVSGEIDALPYVTKTDKRAEEVLFPKYQMGAEQIYLASTESVRLDDDISLLNGKSVGLIAGAFYEDILDRLLEENGIDVTKVYFDTSDERTEAFKVGELDYSIEALSTDPIKGSNVSYTFAEDIPYYFAVSKECPEILEEMNDAQNSLEDDNPAYIHDLNAKYFKSSARYKKLSAAEENWLAEHKVLRIGTFDSDSPYFIDSRGGNYTGIVVDYVNGMLQELGVDNPVRWSLYHSLDELIDALKNGEIDAINPYYDDPCLAEEKGLILTDVVLDTSMSIVYSGRYNENTMTKIATPGTRLGKSYVAEFYPDSEVILCDDGYDSVNKVIRHEATCALFYTDLAEIIVRESGENLNIKALGIPCKLCFASTPENAGLIGLFNKGRIFVTDSEINGIQTKYAGVGENKLTLKMLFKQYPLIVCAAIFIVTSTIAYIIASTSSRESDRKTQNMLEEQMSRVMELSDDIQAIYDIDLETGAYEIFSYNNDYSKMIDNQDGADFFADVQKYADRIVYAEDREMMRDMANREFVEKALAERDDITFDFRLLGSYGPVWYRAKAVRKPGTAHRIIAGAYNVDESIRKEKKHQMELEQAVKMAESANKAKTDFLFNMSHDVRTPMNAIIGYTAMAKKNSDNPQVDDYLNKIDISSKQLLSLVNQVLEMSRIESGKILLVEEHADVIERAVGMQTIIAADCNNKNIGFNLNIGEISHRNVLTDVTRVNQLITNVISNAVKYTPEGGSIDFCLEERPCEKEGYGLYEITVKDNGIGMSEEFLSHIYEEFSRESTSTVSHIQGSGLGMSIVKKLLDLMEGTIDIESKPDEGTSVRISIPMKWDTGEPTDTGGEQRLTNVSIGGMRILLVEDNEMNREIASEILEDEGVIVETAEDGDIAVEIIREMIKSGELDRYNAVLMDIQMPRMDGYEATRQIRAMEPEGIRMPIIALSANAFAEDIKKSYEAGMNEHLSKPIDIRLLKETLAKYL